MLLGIVIVVFNNDIDLGMFCKYVDNGKQDLLIAFSSVNVPPGKFSGSKAFYGINANVLFINCPSNSWYINEIFPGCNDWSANIKYLSNLIKRLTKKDSIVITYGGSMGGYGALLYGLAINADYIFSTGVEHLFYIDGGNTRRYFQGPVNSCIPNPCDLTKDFTGKAYVIYGENFLPDIFCAYDLAKAKGMNVCTIKNQPHSVPPYINNKYGLTDFMFTAISTGELPFEKNDLGDILVAGESIYILYDAFMEVKRDKFTLRTFHELLRLEGSDIKSESCIKYLYKYLGIFHYSFGEYASAIENLQKSAHKGLICSELFAYLSYALFSNNELDKSLQYSSRSIDIVPLVSYRLLMRHVKNLIALKRYKEAFDIIQVKGDFKNAETNFQMSKILESLYNIPEALDYANIAVLMAPNRKPFINWLEKLKVKQYKDKSDVTFKKK